MIDAVAELFCISQQAELFELALTHPSFANERGLSDDNQRLEFLGDAVLELCTSEVLWSRFPNAKEGELTRMRAQLVNASALADWARRHHIAEVLLLGRGAESSGLRDSTNVLADAVEALLAASYLTGGLDSARQACSAIVESQLKELERGTLLDPKTELQETVQAAGLPAPTYALVTSGGPPHARWFEVKVLVKELEIGRGKGRSKRQAERAAAARAIATQGWIGPPPESLRNEAETPDHSLPEREADADSLE